jgi:hypothetical protein
MELIMQGKWKIVEALQLFQDILTLWLCMNVFALAIQLKHEIHQALDGLGERLVLNFHFMVSGPALLNKS